MIVNKVPASKWIPRKTDGIQCTQTRIGSHVRRGASGDPIYRAKYHQAHPLYPVALLTGETTTTTAQSAVASAVLVNTTVTATSDVHRKGFIWPNATALTAWVTRSCTSGVVTLTETVNVTVSVTASPSPAPDTVVYRNTTAPPWHCHGSNGTIHCASTRPPSAPDSLSMTSDLCLDSTWTSTLTRATTTQSPSLLTDATIVSTTPSQTSTEPSANVPPWVADSAPKTVRYSLSHISAAPTSDHTVITTVTSTYMIDPLLLPVTTGPPSAFAFASSTVASSTSTVCAETATSGAPNPAHVHCGVRGLSAGGNFLGRFVENAAGAQVTLEGCWQFCGVSVNKCSPLSLFLTPQLEIPSIRRVARLLFSLVLDSMKLTPSKKVGMGRRAWLFSLCLLYRRVCSTSLRSV